MATGVMPGKGLAELAIVFANVFLIIGAGLSTIGLAYSFVLYLTSGGDPKAVQRAQRALFWSLVAMLVSAIAWGVKAVLFTMLDVKDVY